MDSEIHSRVRVGGGEEKVKALMMEQKGLGFAGEGRYVRRRNWRGKSCCV